MSNELAILQRLMDVIVQRQKEMPTGSYTTSLFSAGTAKIAAKITEEAGEVVEAAGESDDAGREHLVCEAADLVYHLLVMLAHRGTNLAQVAAELDRRFGLSGLDEKAARGAPAPAEKPPTEKPPTEKPPTKKND